MYETVDLSKGEHHPRYTVRKLSHTVPVGEFVAECVDIPKFEALCRECGSYGNRWACPPFPFSPLELWNRYALFQILAWKVILELGQTPEDAVAALEIEKQAFLTEVLQMEREIPGSMAISAGTCTYCGQTCARSLGKPCLHPEQLRYSVEALGGNVTRAAELYLNTAILWIRNDAAPAYLMIVGGLLLPEGAKPAENP